LPLAGSRWSGQDGSPADRAPALGALASIYIGADRASVPRVVVGVVLAVILARVGFALASRKPWWGPLADRLWSYEEPVGAEATLPVRVRETDQQRANIEAMCRSAAPDCNEPRPDGRMLIADALTWRGGERRSGFQARCLSSSDRARSRSPLICQTTIPRPTSSEPAPRTAKMATVVGMVADGMSEPEITTTYPDLKTVDVREALRYAAEAVSERELPLIAPLGDLSTDELDLRVGIRSRPLPVCCQGWNSQPRGQR
jgi:hypothetical protein